MACKNFLHILFFLSFMHHATAQSIQLGGYITDKETGEALIGATIYSITTQTGCVSNKYGFYSLALASSTLEVSYLGYETQKIPAFQATKDTTLHIQLSPNEHALEELVITSSQKRLEEKPELGKVSIPVSQLKLLPSITGETDILKGLQLVPGIQSGTEGNNGLYVRGGTPDQNLFLLDDVPLYNVNHLGGFFSIFDPSMVKSVEVYKGGFPARYGGRISAVADVRNKEGNLHNHNGQVGLSAFLSKVFIEGPIIKGKASYAFSVRRSNLDAYSFLFNRLASNQYNQGYYFYDINLKTNYKVNEANQLFIHLYKGADSFYFREKDGAGSPDVSYDSKYTLKWGNTLSSLRWLHLFGNRFFNNTTVALSQYDYNNSYYLLRRYDYNNSELSDHSQLRSGVKCLLVKNDSEVSFSKTTFRFGAIAKQYSFNPNSISYQQEIRINDTVKILNAKDNTSYVQAHSLFGYVEIENQIGSKLKSHLGLRGGTYFVDQSTFPSIEPRIVLNYQIATRFSVKASYSKMHQYIHLLTNSNTGLPTDIWVPTTALLPPESSDQISLGIAHTTSLGYEFSLETYYKKLTNLIDYKEGILIFNSAVNWDDKVEKQGIGEIKGIEFMITKSVGRVTGWLGYSLTSNDRHFENLNNGNVFPFKYEQKHNGSAVGIYKINEKLSTSLTWIYRSGNRITLPSGKYDLYNINYSDSYGDTREILSEVHIYSEKNAYKMPNYHRLDIGLTYKKQKKRGTAIWNIGVYNVYNRQNAYYLFFKTDASTGETRLYQQSLYPLLINFGYTFQF